MTDIVAAIPGLTTLHPRTSHARTSNVPSHLRAFADVVGSASTIVSNLVHCRRFYNLCIPIWAPDKASWLDAGCQRSRRFRTLLSTKHTDKCQIHGTSPCSVSCEELQQL